MLKEGIINVNKPAGMSSHDIVNIVRRLTGVKRIGHTGTLDPQATGVLPVCIGTASRITEYLDLDMKTYLCSMYLGVTSDTLDIWGKEVTDRRDEIRANAPDAGRIREAFSGFSGVVTQVPPKFSAASSRERTFPSYTTYRACQVP